MDTSVHDLLLIMNSVPVRVFIFNPYPFRSRKPSIRHQSTILNTKSRVPVRMEYRGDIDAWYNKGYALKEQGKLDQAIVAFDKALEVAPEDARIWTIKGNTLLELRQFENAIDAYTHVLITYPDNTDTIVNIASAMIEMGKYDEAIVECNRALEIDPDHYLAPVFLQQAKEKIKYE